MVNEICWSHTALSFGNGNGLYGYLETESPIPPPTAEVWQHAKRMLADSSLDMVLLDELTYMVAYDYCWKT